MFDDHSWEHCQDLGGSDEGILVASFQIHGHADAGIVTAGDVRAPDFQENDSADAAAVVGRLRQSELVKKTRQALLVGSSALLPQCWTFTSIWLHHLVMSSTKTGTVAPL